MAGYKEEIEGSVHESFGDFPNFPEIEMSKINSFKDFAQQVHNQTQNFKKIKSMKESQVSPKFDSTNKSVNFDKSLNASDMIKREKQPNVDQESQLTFNLSMSENGGEKALIQHL